MRRSIPFLLLLLGGLALPCGARDLLDETDPFDPFWSFRCVLTHSTQDGGQVSNDLAFTATRNLSEAGHFVLGGLNAGRKKLEGHSTPYGSLTMGGGLGVGIFTPSLTLTFGGGDRSYRYFEGSLGLDFQVADPLSVSLTLSRQVQEHSTTVGEFLGTSGRLSDRSLTIGSNAWGASLGAALLAKEWLEISVSGTRMRNVTEGIRDEVSGRELRNSGGEGTSTYATLGLGFHFLRRWSAGVSYQRGHDTYPDELYYVARLGRSLDLSGGSADWDGSSVWLGFRF